MDWSRTRIAVTFVALLAVYCVAACPSLPRPFRFSFNVRLPAAGQRSYSRGRKTRLFAAETYDAMSSARGRAASGIDTVSNRVIACRCRCRYRRVTVPFTGLQTTAVPALTANLCGLSLCSEDLILVISFSHLCTCGCACPVIPLRVALRAQNELAAFKRERPGAPPVGARRRSP